MFEEVQKNLNQKTRETQDSISKHLEELHEKLSKKIEESRKNLSQEIKAPLKKKKTDSNIEVISYTTYAISYYIMVYNVL